MNTKDVELLYHAYVKLCNFIETNYLVGCSECPLAMEACFNTDESKRKEFYDALSRIRKECGIIKHSDKY